MSSNCFKLAAVGICVGLAAATAARALDIPLNRHGLAVVPSIEIYRSVVQEAPEHKLVDLETAVPGVRLDIRYATTDNFMKRQLYPVARAYLRRPAAEALAAIQQELAARGLGLKVFDGYRPYRVTEAMWEPIQNPDFVADPKEGSKHNRGCAVDLTVVDAKTGAELSMPTPYDDFTPRAAYAFTDLPADVLEHRTLLRDVMERHGFEAIDSEWWHFDFKGWDQYELLDLPLESVDEANRGL